MYIYIKGILKHKDTCSVIIENSGIGYEINIGLLTYNDLPSASEEVLLHTFHYIREDREELFGFSTTGEKSLFEILIGISSIGPNKALGMLSQVSPSDFIQAVKSNNKSLIASIKGIGVKTAERIIIELRDKLDGIPLESGISSAGNDIVEDALGALVGLGFKDSAARDMIFAVRSELTADDDVQDVIRKALRKNNA